MHTKDLPREVIAFTGRRLAHPKQPVDVPAARLNDAALMARLNELILEAQRRASVRKVLRTILADALYETQIECLPPDSRARVIEHVLEGEDVA